MALTGPGTKTFEINQVLNLVRATALGSVAEW